MNGDVKQNLDYTSKPIPGHPDPKIANAPPPLRPAVRWGTPPQQGKRNDLHDAIESVRAASGNPSKKLRLIAEEHPSVFIKYHRGIERYIKLTSEPPKKPHPGKWREWQQWLVDYLTTKPNDRNILWVYDPDGNQGKSTFVNYFTSNFPSEYISLEGKSADMAYAYDDQRVVFFDIARANVEMTDYLYNVAEKLKNGQLFSSKYDSGVKIFDPPHVVFMSNSLPTPGKWSEDRCILVNLKPFSPHTIPVPLFVPPALPAPPVDIDMTNSDDDESGDDLSQVTDGTTQPYVPEEFATGG